MYRLVLLAIGLCSLLIGGLQGAVGQDGMEATPATGFVTPDPTACQIEPRALESVIALVGTPTAIQPATPSVGEGQPADADIVAAVTAVAEESVACFNAGNFLAQFAFYTDDALAALIPPGLTADDLAGFLGAPPEPLPVEARESVLVRDVMILPDGRVNAYVVLRNLEGTFTTFVTFEQQGDRYVITADIDVDVELATPVA